MCEITFYNKTTGKKTIKKNCSFDVKITHSKGKGKGMYIGFFNYSFDILGAKKNRIEVGVRGSRLFFHPNDEHGYKVQVGGGDRQKEGSCHISFPIDFTELTEWAETYPGKYSLLFDESEKLYCIDANGAAS